MEPRIEKFCDLDLGPKIRAYAEIVIVSSLFFLYAAVLTAIASLIWTRWADQKFEWEFGLVVGIIGLLPYMVVAAAVWRVNLSILGNRVDNVPRVGSNVNALRGQL